MSLIIAILLGLAYVLPPGPVTVETARRSILGGIRSALAVQLGAVVGDMIYAALVVAGIGSLLLQTDIQRGLGLVGAALLVYLGITAIRDRHMLNIGHSVAQSADPDRATIRRSFGAGLALALANPYAIIFWASYGSTAIEGSAASFGGFILGSLLGSLLTALAAGQLHHQRMLRLSRWIWSGCGGLLVILGAHLGHATLAAW